MANPLPPLIPFERRATIGQSFCFMGSLATILAASSDTNGQFGLVEFLVKPGSEPPMHVHEREDELLYLIQGEVDCLLDGCTIPAITGSSVFLPRKLPHTFRVKSAQAWLLLFVTPGGLEDYFRELAQPACTVGVPALSRSGTPAETERAAEIAARYGVRFLTRPRAREGASGGDEGAEHLAGAHSLT